MKNLYNNKEVTKRILDLIQVRNLSRYKFSKEIGVTESALSRNILGKSKWGVELLLNVSQYFKVSMDWLMNGGDEISFVKEPLAKYGAGYGSSKKVPILGYAECGKAPTTWYQSGNKFIELSDVSHLRNPFVIIARGDSMRPYINPQDKLLCTDQPERIKDRTAVIVVFKSPPETYEANAKLILFNKKMGMITLYSVNTMFEPTFHREEEIAKIYKVIRIIREVK